LTAHKIAEVFGTRLKRNHRGRLLTVIDQIEHGHHVFRAYFRNAVLRQYEKFSMFLRNELCSNNLYDFGLKKRLDHLDEVHHKFQSIISRFAGFQAQWLNVHTDFPLLQRIALPITVGAVRHPGIKIQDTRIIRLLEVLSRCVRRSSAARSLISTNHSTQRIHRDWHDTAQRQARPSDIAHFYRGRSCVA
jgi:hypothetical protein